MDRYWNIYRQSRQVSWRERRRGSDPGDAHPGCSTRNVDDDVDALCEGARAKPPSAKETRDVAAG